MQALSIQEVCRAQMLEDIHPHVSIPSFGIFSHDLDLVIRDLPQLSV
jgi:hypothetical protein